MLLYSNTYVYLLSVLSVNFSSNHHTYKNFTKYTINQIHNIKTKQNQPNNIYNNDKTKMAWDAFWWLIYLFMGL